MNESIYICTGLNREREQKVAAEDARLGRQRQPSVEVRGEGRGARECPALCCVVQCQFFSLKTS